MLTVETAILSV